MNYDNDQPAIPQPAGGGARRCELCGHVAPAWRLAAYYYAAEAWLWRCLDTRACEGRLMAQLTRDLGDRCPGCG
jgi:hypothetical protein